MKASFFRAQSEKNRQNMSAAQTNFGGFTIVELLVVISIIAILSAIVIAGVSDSRARARDGQREAELAQIQVALEQFRQFSPTSSFPSHDSGTAIGVGNSIDAEIDPFLSSVPTDPLSSTSGYQYYYDSSFNCANEGSGKIALFATKTERTSSSNFETVCGSGSDTVGDGITAVESEIYVILLN